MDATDDVLALRQWGASFGPRVILNCVDLRLPAQGIDVLMGPVKAGKSTLLRSLAGLNDGNALFRSWGEALLQGRPIGDGWRPLLVQQHAAILHGTVRDALVYHCRQQAGRSALLRASFAQDALREHGLSELAQAPDAAMLSLPTERQRAVNILSHALTRPPLLFVDEPTYGLSESAAAWLVQWLAELGGSTRLVVVLHHQGQARTLADRVTLFGGGRVLACEPADRFFAGKVNAWVEQFVRSGSLSIASPDAAPEDLGPDVTAPAPLLPAALAAVAPFKQPPAKPVPVPVAPPAVVSRTADPPAVAPVAPRTPAALPSLSRHGVEDASLVGQVMLSAYRGPQGFSWIVPGKLAGCAEPGISSPLDYDLDLLVRMGVTRLITLTEKDLDDAALARHGLHNLHLPIFDREAPSLAQTYMLIRRMQALMDEGQVLAVHCKAGIGRTGTILAAWMIREGGVSAAVAIERLRRINPAYVQTDIQEQFLHDFEQDILKRL